MFAGTGGSGINQPVSVHVEGKGKASGELAFSYGWSLTGISQDSGSYGGRTIDYN